MLESIDAVNADIKDRDWSSVRFVCYVGLLICGVVSVFKGNFVLALFLAFAGLVICIWTTNKESDSSKQKVAKYESYLSNLEFGLLKDAAVSPELDFRSRNVIVQFLSRKYPGWSFTAEVNNAKQMRP